MKIAIITPFPPTAPGGVEKFTLVLTDLLRGAGHHVKLFDITALKDKKYTGLFEPKKLGQYKLAYDLAKAFEQEQDDFDVAICNGMFGWKMKFPRTIVIAHGNVGHYADSSKQGMSLLSYLKTRYVDVWFQTKSFSKKTLVVVSSQTGQECRKYNKINTYTVIENTVNENKFRPRNDKRRLRDKYGLPQDKFFGLFTGRPEYRKGFDIVVATANRLSDEHRIVAAVPFETGKARNLIQLIDVPFEDIHELYNACDYFYLPSRHEGCSIALLEGMASGLPVITTVVGNGLDIAKKNPDLGRFIFEEHSVESFMQAAVALYDSPKLRQELGGKARNYVLQYNIKSAFLREYLSLIKRVGARE